MLPLAWSGIVLARTDGPIVRTRPSNEPHTMRSPHRHVLIAAGTLAALAALAPRAEAQRISTRDHLLLILGSSATTETFDGPTADGSMFAHGAIPVLDASTNVPGLGTGVVQEGIELRAPNNGHWFIPPHYATLGNPDGLYAGAGSFLDITFTSPTTAFGLDLWVSWYHPLAATVSVYGADGALVSASTFVPARGEFFGWEHADGISRVRLTGGSNDALSVRIDDLTYGVAGATVTPEPATLALVGTGLAAVVLVGRRRRVLG